MKNTSILRTVIVLALLSLAVSTAIAYYLENQELRENMEGSTKNETRTEGDGKEKPTAELDEELRPSLGNNDKDQITIGGEKRQIKLGEVYAKSTSGAFLYSECLNKIQLKTIRGEGYEYGKVVANQSSVIWGRETGHLSIDPSGKNCIMEVYSIQNKNSSPVLVDTFGVIKPPLPQLELLVNGKVYNGVTPIPKSSKCRVRVLPDEGFKEIYGNDARYSISRIELFAHRSLGAAHKIGKYSGNGKDAEKGVEVKLGNKLKNEAPGTKIYLKLDEVYRLNYKNKRIEVPLSDDAKVLDFIVK